MSTLPFGVIDDARGRYHRQLGVIGATAAVATLAAFAWGGAGAGQPAGIGGSPSSRPSLAGTNVTSVGRALSVLGLSVVEPAGWFGHAAVLPVGGPGAAWLHASNFTLRISKRGVDPIESMGVGGVVLTITTAGPFASNIRPAVQPLALAANAIPTRRTPRGHLVLEESAMLGGGLVSISAEFGSRSAAPRLLPVVNGVLRSLREQPRH